MHSCTHTTDAEVFSGLMHCFLNVSIYLEFPVNKLHPLNALASLKHALGLLVRLPDTGQKRNSLIKTFTHDDKENKK